MCIFLARFISLVLSQCAQFVEPGLRAGTADRNWIKLCAAIVYIGKKKGRVSVQPICAGLTEKHGRRQDRTWEDGEDGEEGRDGKSESSGEED